MQQSGGQGFGRTFGASSEELIQLPVDGEVPGLLKQNDCGSAQVKKPRLNPYNCLKQATQVREALHEVSSCQTLRELEQC